jgi:hypothetical protein
MRRRTNIMSWPRRVGYQGCSNSLIKYIRFMPLSEIKLIIMLIVMMVIIIIIIIIIIRGNEKETGMLIDVAISGDRNVIKKEAEKILKYKDLTVEIQRMWNVKMRVLPVVIGATGTISKSFRKYVSNIPGNHDVRELQKTPILGTAHILRKVLT